MEIKHEHNGHKGAFYIETDGERLGQMVYTDAGPDKFIIEHTEVSEKLKGQGAGAQMLKAAVEMARKNNMKIVPVCPFAKSVFEKKEEFRDVLA